MATSILKTKNDVLKIHRYVIDIKNDVGKGAYGIVYTGKDDKDRTVAAKKIDGKQHPRILSQKLNRLLQLNHPNIVSIFDIHQEDQIFWMFMPFCTHSDLGKFCKGKTLSLDQKLEIMSGIAKGVCYLHDNDIIHRDIKPPNILIADDSPIVTKLTDFDFSKCLDPEVETSMMSSNVGTWAYKAPEFFNRVDGHIRYHRNVDIYACALTFLAINQATDGKAKLVPRIETPQDNSEKHAPSIGQLIAERIKYKVPVLNIVIIDKSTSGPEMEIKKLIQKMTCVDPKKRLSAAQVSLILEQVTSAMPLDLGSTQRQEDDLGGAGLPSDLHHTYVLTSPLTLQPTEPEVVLPASHSRLRSSRETGRKQSRVKIAKELREYVDLQQQLDLDYAQRRRMASKRTLLKNQGDSTPDSCLHSHISPSPMSSFGGVITIASPIFEERPQFTPPPTLHYQQFTPPPPPPSPSVPVQYQRRSLSEPLTPVKWPSPSLMDYIFNESAPIKEHRLNAGAAVAFGDLKMRDRESMPPPRTLLLPPRKLPPTQRSHQEGMYESDAISEPVEETPSTRPEQEEDLSSLEQFLGAIYQPNTSLVAQSSATVGQSEVKPPGDERATDELYSCDASPNVQCEPPPIVLDLPRSSITSPASDEYISSYLIGHNIHIVDDQDCLQAD